LFLKCLQEGCAAANSTIVMLQGLAARARALGKRLVYQCHTDAPVETGNLPAFLIGAGVDHYLTIGGWVDDAPSAHWSPIFDRPLGQPLGDGVYDAPTAMWSREFQSGTKVTFNAQMSIGAIAWASNRSHSTTDYDVLARERSMNVAVDTANGTRTQLAAAAAAPAAANAPPAGHQQSTAAPTTKRKWILNVGGGTTDVDGLGVWNATADLGPAVMNRQGNAKTLLAPLRHNLHD
jgi:hypothetical protein